MTAPDLPERLAAARQEASSPDETVTAVVDGTGRVVELRLDAKAMRLAAERLAATITATVQAAQDGARTALGETSLSRSTHESASSSRTECPRCSSRS